MSTSQISVRLKDENATILFGQDLAACLKPGDVLELSGELGAGKSTLARSIIRSLADDDALEVPSPTFTLVQQYEARFPVIHADLYRISSPDELDELGLAEPGSESIVLVEWPENANGNLPDQSSLKVRLDTLENGRILSASGTDEVIKRLKRSLTIRHFLDKAGYSGAKRSHLTGDASARAYERVFHNGASLVLMNAPEQPDGPVVRDGKPYSRIAHLAENVGPFLAIDAILREHGFCAPEIFASDRKNGILLLENLGTEPFLIGGREPLPERYHAAAELLAKMHEIDWPRRVQVDAEYTHEIPRYDREALLIEAELLADWYVPFVSGHEISAEDRSNFLSGWNVVLDTLNASETTLVLRDYHSPNIVWRDEKDEFDRLGLIDFQDAVIGPSAYDLASLAQDARVTISEDLEKSIFDAYCDARSGSASFDRAGFERDYAIMTVQRNTKILGIFVRLDRRDGKPAYLTHLPRIKRYLERSLRHPALSPLQAFYARLDIGKA